MIFTYGFGWLALFFLPKQRIIPALKCGAGLGAAILPFQFILSGGVPLLASFLAFHFVMGVCCAAAFYIFCFTLNNVERLVGMAIIRLQIGFVYSTLQLPILSADRFMQTWGSGILMALCLAAAFCCFRKEKSHPVGAAHLTDAEQYHTEPADNNFNTPVFIVILLYAVYYLVWSMAHYMKNWVDDPLVFTAYGLGGSIAAIAFVFVMHLVINRSAMYSWLFFLAFSLLGISLFQQDSPFTHHAGSFFFGLGDGIGYIIIFFMCGGAIKQSKSLKMYRIFCLVFFVLYTGIAGIISKVYSNLFMGQSPLPVNTTGQNGHCVR
jgi:hypothetical protein